ncbi:MAG: AAA-like domain-containing protein [Chloroflexota bacterium]
MTRTRDFLPLRYRTQLTNQINDYFSVGELKTLCFELGIVYDDLVGPTKTNIIEDLVGRFQRFGEIPRLVSLCQSKRSHLVWTYQARLFICYKRYAAIDSALANILASALTEEGHQPFIDKSMRVGTTWLDEIDHQLSQSDYLIVLLSNQSADSEMVQQEVYRAYEYRRTQGWPIILPIRIQFDGMLPYSIAAFINARQYLVWTSEADNQRVLSELLGVLKGNVLDQPFSAEAFIRYPITLISEDGRPKQNEKDVYPPLPEFDPRLLSGLPAPGGTMRISDTLYIEREADARLRHQLSLSGTITTIRASRQTGKSSMLVRGIHHARQAGAHVVCLDLQSVDSDDLAASDVFLRYLSNFIVNRLRQDLTQVERFWQIPLGAQDRLTALMEEYVLPALDQPMVLAIDEADRLLETSYYSDFFGLLRSWHNSAAYEPLWEMMNLAMVISTEPYLLIADPNQSPFNVGLKLYLEDFSKAQVEDLNRRHGHPLSSGDLADFQTLLGGHPYLTRKALYTLVTERMDWPALREVAASDGGPFSDHLRRQMWLLHKRPELIAALRAIIRRQKCDDEDARFRLLRAGLIQASGDICTPRCELYEVYFRDRLE